MPPRKYNPLTVDHPLVRDGVVCPRCGVAFKELDEVTLVDPRPGDEEEAAKAAAGRAWTARVTPVHWACLRVADSA